jgi:alpha-L-arabinofuranosidase
MINALSEAAFMTSLERNGDIVKMASYAPLLANLNHTSWNPNLIYFNNKTMVQTVNYYVQQLFSTNQGDIYMPDKVEFINDKAGKDSTLAASCVKDNKTGDIILKIVNAGPDPAPAKIGLADFNVSEGKASVKILKGAPADKNTFVKPVNITPESASISFAELQNYIAPAYSLSIIRFNPKKQ